MRFSARHPFPWCAAWALILGACAPSHLPGNPRAASGAGEEETVKIPSQDPTPPMAALDVVGAQTTLILTTGMEPEALALSPDDSLVLLAMGEDADGGVKALSLSGNAKVSCKDPITGKASTRTTGFQRRSVAGSLRQARAPMRKTARFVLRAADFAPLCPGGGITGLVGQAGVSTANFHGGHAASPRLEFRLAEAGARALASRFPPAVTQAIQTPTGYGNASATGSALTAAGAGGFPGGSGSPPAAAPGTAFCPLCAAPQPSLRPGPGVPAKRACADPPVPFMSPKAEEAASSPIAPAAGGDGPMEESPTAPKTPSSPIPREARI